MPSPNLQNTIVLAKSKLKIEYIQHVSYIQNALHMLITLRSTIYQEIREYEHKIQINT